MNVISMLKIRYYHSLWTLFRFRLFFVATSKGTNHELSCHGEREALHCFLFTFAVESFHWFSMTSFCCHLE